MDYGQALGGSEKAKTCDEEVIDKKSTRTEEGVRQAMISRGHRGREIKSS